MERGHECFIRLGTSSYGVDLWKGIRWLYSRAGGIGKLPFEFVFLTLLNMFLNEHTHKA